MKKPSSYLLVLPLAALALAGCSADKTAKSAEDEINDSTSPLHLLQPDYVTPYGQITSDSVKAVVDRVFNYLDAVTPAKVVDREGNEITDLEQLPDSAMLNQGTYRLTSYEWGVTYKALLDAARIFNDKRYSDYVFDRTGFLARVAPAFIAQAERTGKMDAQMRNICRPASLDDAGAMSGAFMEVAMADSTLDLREVIERYWDVVSNKTLRLPDGTIARNRPHHNAVWLDDMFMAIPAMASRSRYASDPSQLNDAARTALGFFKRMWMPEKRIFRHGYVEGLEAEPSMAWGRANGWAILTMCQLLDALPENHPDRAKVMDIYKQHVAGLTALQNKDGFWHQLLDRNDSYPETSATAIFAYCIAHGVNEGWLDAVTYGPVAQLAWEAVTTKINEKGEVEDVCVGTGMGFDPAYYYYRPVSVKAAHGYGPVIWAGSEVARMLDTYHPRINDSAIHYYRIDPEASTPIFSLDDSGKAAEIKH
ncbi:MAG: glycoside hydrolase family 88 protein [Muribaculaceae bacterium]|nr:glycoside hydrolase family 88 protein [Muribaculaceae bacterium]